jgi:TolB protein
MNRLRWIALGALLFTLLPPTVPAQTPQDSVTTRKVVTRSGYRLPVAVSEFTLGGGSATPELLAQMQEVAEIVRQDLAFSGYFRVVRFDSLYLRYMGVSTLDLEGWSHLGAEYLGSGSVTPSGDGFRITFTLTGTLSHEGIFEKSFAGVASQRRQVAHQIANEVIYYLWGGRTRIFETRIVATHQAGNAKELYLCDFDGAAGRPLTNNGSLNLSPAWFPGGDRLVFTSYRDGNPDLWLLLLRNNALQKISDRVGLNTAPVIWPDGRFIVVTLTVDGNAELYLLTDAGKIARRLTQSPSIESEPTVSPDGRQIAFTSDRLGLPQIFVMDADGSNVHRVTFQGNYNASPAWSPRGDKIAYVTRSARGGFDLCTINPDGTNLAVLTTSGSNEDPAWSPDGYHLVFSSQRNGERNLYTITFDGTNERPITTGGGYSGPAWGPFPRP